MRLRAVPTPEETFRSACDTDGSNRLSRSAQPHEIKIEPSEQETHSGAMRRAGERRRRSPQSLSAQIHEVHIEPQEQEAFNDTLPVTQNPSNVAPCFPNHCTERNFTPRRSEANGIAEKAVRRVKEGMSAVLLQSGLDERWLADSMGC